MCTTKRWWCVVFRILTVFLRQICIFNSRYQTSHFKSDIRFRVSDLDGENTASLLWHIKCSKSAPRSALNRCETYITNYLSPGVNFRVIIKVSHILSILCENRTGVSSILYASKENLSDMFKNPICNEYFKVNSFKTQ